MSDSDVCVSRRRWLMQSAGVACVAAAGPLLAHCTGGGGGGLVNAGSAVSYSVGTFRVVENVIVGRDAIGLYAYSNVCTHEGTAIPAPTGGVSICPQHLSHFNANGDVQPGGLAMRDLPHYAVSINAGNVVVDTSMTLTDRTTRTPVV